MTENLLGEFLRARRARVDPSDVGLRTLGTRRTPGLRREEVASVAGISVEYLIRLERGTDRNPSPAVVRSLAEALRLDEPAALHLHSLATSGGPVVADVFEVDPDLVRLLESLQAPAMIASRFFDLLAVNSSCALLYDGWSIAPGDNLARHLFLHPDAERIYLNRDELAAETVGNLRAQTDTSPIDPHLQQLVGELSTESELFAQLWALSDVRPKTAGRKRVWQPEVGELTIDWFTLSVAAAPGQMLVAYQAEAGSESERRLQGLVARATAGTG